MYQCLSVLVAFSAAILDSVVCWMPRFVYSEVSRALTVASMASNLGL